MDFDAEIAEFRTLVGITGIDDQIMDQAAISGHDAGIPTGKPERSHYAISWTFERTTAKQRADGDDPTG